MRRSCYCSIVMGDGDCVVQSRFGGGRGACADVEVLAPRSLAGLARLLVWD